MATLDEQFFGKGRGRIGDFVLKKRYGRQYIARRPSKVKTPMDSGSVFRRSKFRICSKLFSALGKNFWIKFFWKEADIPKDTWLQKMIHVNYERITENLDFRDILMVPAEEGFEAQLENYTFENGVLTVKIKPFPDDSVVTENSRLSLQGLFYFNTTDDKTIDPYLFVSFSAEDQKYVPGESMTFSASIHGEEKVASKNYQKYSLLVNLFIKDSNGKPTNISENIYFE